MMEIMVSAALVGIIMSAVMVLFGKVGTFTSTFSGQANTVEGVTEAVGLFSSIIPQATRITSCRCNSNLNSRAGCVWSSASPWHDPVRTGGATSPVTILAGEYEAFEGTQAIGDMDALTKGNITISGQTCLSQNSDLTASLLRGCKLSFSLDYTAPTAVSGAVPSNGGKVVLTAGVRTVQIGASTPNGAGGLAVTELSCGLDNSSGGVVGASYVLNMKLKSKSSRSENTSSSAYDSFYPGDSTYYKGQFREVRLKYNLRNLSNRGVYFWKPYSEKNCLEIGTAAASASRCCSRVISGGVCATCVRSGQSGSAATCCSGAVTGATCN